MHNPKQFFARMARLAARLTLPVLVAACASDGSGPDTRVASVQVSPSGPTLTAIGATVQLNAGLLTAGGGSATAQGSLSWTSLNTAVATVNSSGLVTAVSNGTATIAAEVDGVQGTTTVTVSQQATSLVVTAPTTSFASLQLTSQYSAEARDSRNNPVAGVSVSWSSSATGVATVSTSGLVRSIANGTASVIASAGAIADTVTVTVAQVVNSVTLSGYSALNTYNQTDQLTATARDANNQTVNGQAFSWTSSSTTVATVSTSGLVTAKDEGTATITATATGTTRTASQAYSIAFVVASNQTVTGNLSSSTDTDTYDWSTSVGARFVAWVYGATSTKSLVFAPQPGGTGTRSAAPRQTGGIIAGSDVGASLAVLTVGGSSGDFTLMVNTTCYEFAQRGPSAFTLSDQLYSSDCGVPAATGTPTSSASSLARATQVPVQLTAGQTYTFYLSSSAFDTYLMVFGPNGQAWYDDDGGTGLNSRLLLTAPVSGLYTFMMTSYGANELGAFTLSLTLGNNPVYGTDLEAAPAAVSEADVLDAQRRQEWAERALRMGPGDPAPASARIK